MKMPAKLRNRNIAAPPEVVRQLKQMAAEKGTFMWRLICEKCDIPVPIRARPGGTKQYGGRPKGSKYED